MIVNRTVANAYGCSLVYFQGSRLLYLANRGSNAWAGSATPGQSGTLQNSQCSINAAASSVSGSGNNLTLNVALSFQTAFSGTKNSYMDAYDGAYDDAYAGWRQKGTCTL